MIESYEKLGEIKRAQIKNLVKYIRDKPETYEVLQDEFEFQTIVDASGFIFKNETNQEFEITKDGEDLLAGNFLKPSLDIPTLRGNIDPMEIVGKYIEFHPIMFDKSRNYFLWSIEKKIWEMADEIDILSSLHLICNDSGILSSQVKGQLLDSFKIHGRRKANIIQEQKKSWVQYGNKIIDVFSGEFITPSPDYFISNRVPHELGESEETPIIDKLLKEWGGEDSALLEEILAFCLLDDYLIHKMFFLLGKGRNGKDKFCDLLSRLVGDENTTAVDLDKLVTSRFEASNLYKKKVALVSETDYGILTSTKAIKQCTGASKISAEFKNKASFKMTSYAKVLIATNGIPRTTDHSDAWYSRSLIIDFKNQFPEGKNPVDLVPELEYENFCRKSLKILKELKERGSFIGEGNLEEKRKKYEDKSNPINKFLNEYVVEDIEGRIPMWEFKERLKGYCQSINQRELSNQEVNNYLKTEKYLEYKKARFGDKTWQAWLGIAWKPISKIPSKEDNFNSTVAFGQKESGETSVDGMFVNPPIVYESKE